MDSPIQKILNDSKAPARLRKLCLERSVFREQSPFRRKFRRARQQPTTRDATTATEVPHKQTSTEGPSKHNESRFCKVYKENLLAAIKMERVDVVERHLSEGVRSGALTKDHPLVRRALEFICTISS